ncbi:hypothetical protein [Spiroplasma poulsonii]|uniref:hypothetical protein n=1 Tax=Spiroplasma poulsonii TaxID=2138 RepID=UPI001F4C9F5A|nr:hypothetical protein [Spiroplasma poulsonii]UNF62116.1 hypothetical protein MNU24_01235 [Spiroplasma poulsonii]
MKTNKLSLENRLLMTLYYNTDENIRLIFILQKFWLLVRLIVIVILSELKIF